MNVKICSSYLPLKGTNDSACYDLVAESDPFVVGHQSGADLYRSIHYIEYNTGIKLHPPFGYFVKVYPRSSISNYNLLLCNSVAVGDFDYRGYYKLRFKYIFQPQDLIYDSRRLRFHCKIDYDKIYQKGDKIAQMTICKMEYIDWEKCEKLQETIRNDNGFGSTGI